MRRIFFLFIIPLILVISSSTLLSDYEIEWMDMLDLDGFSDFSRAVATDNGGNIFVAGGGARLIKYNSATGETIWTSTAPAYVLYGVATGESEQYEKQWADTVKHAESWYGRGGCATDSDGNIYVSGHKVNAGPYTIKYSPAGESLWADYINLTNGGSHGIAVDKNGAIVVAGYSWLKNGCPSNRTNFYIVRYKPSGSSYIIDWVDTLNNDAISDTFTSDIPGDQGGGAIAVDTDCNIYVTGRSSPFGVTDCYYWTVKYDSLGNKQWDRAWGEPGKDNRAYAVATDPVGNVVVTGKARSVYSIGGILTLKYNSSGTLQWADSCKFYSAGNGVVMDNSGDVYITGQVTAPTWAIYTRKLTSSGNFVWSDTIDFANVQIGRAVTTDADGNIIVGGYHYHPKADYYVIKYSPLGESLFAFIDTTDSMACCYGVATDGNDIILSGDYKHSSKYGIYTVKYAKDIIVVVGNDYNFVTSTNSWWIGKYNSSGDIQWADTFDFGYGDKLCIAHDVVTDVTGNYFVTGYYVDNSNNSHMHTRKYDASNSLIWQRTIDNGKRAYGIALDPDGNIIITGSGTTVQYNSSGTFQWSRVIGSGSEGVATGSTGDIYVVGNVQVASTRDCHLAKYNSSGTLQWADTIESSAGYDYFYGVAVDTNGNIIATGYLYNGTDNDYFTVEYNASGEIVWADTIDNGSEDYAQKVAADDDGNVFVTGYSLFSGFDYFTLKYKYTSPTVVELVNFEAIGREGFVDIKWMTEVEIDNYKWLISRSTENDGVYKKIAEQDAMGSGPNNYTYTDLSVIPNRSYWYKLGDMDTDGKITWHGPVNAIPKPGTKFLLSLSSSSPNPSKSISKIEYQVPNSSGNKPLRVTLKVYNLVGQLVKTLVNEQKKPGHYTVRWDGKDNSGKRVPSGIYFYRLEANDRLTRKLIRL